MIRNPAKLSASDLAEKYFETYPEEKEPLWTNPCDDQRHVEILPENRREKCKNLPDFLILGPQKTGSTALHTFLKVWKQDDQLCVTFSVSPNT